MLKVRVCLLFLFLSATCNALEAAPWHCGYDTVYPEPGQISVAQRKIQIQTPDQKAPSSS